MAYQVKASFSFCLQGKSQLGLCPDSKVYDSKGQYTVDSYHVLYQTKCVAQGSRPFLVDLSGIYQFNQKEPPKLGFFYNASKVEIFLEQRKVAFLSPSKICENLNFSTVHPEKFKFSQILPGDKNPTYLCSKIISTLPTVSLSVLY